MFADNYARIDSQVCRDRNNVRRYIFSSLLYAYRGCLEKSLLRMYPCAFCISCGMNPGLCVYSIIAAYHEKNEIRAHSRALAHARARTYGYNDLIYLQFTGRRFYCVCVYTFGNCCPSSRECLSKRCSPECARPGYDLNGVFVESAVESIPIYVIRYIYIHTILAKYIRARYSRSPSGEYVYERAVNINSN